MTALRTLVLASVVSCTPVLAEAPASNPDGALTLLHCGQLVDVRAGKLLGATSVKIADGRITSVTSGKADIADATLIDLSTKTCLPGFIDSHTHITGETSAKAYEEGFRLNPADYALRGAAYAKRTLMAGFTTVRNLGDSDNVSISLRNAIDQGYVNGPRIYSAGKTLGRLPAVTPIPPTASVGGFPAIPVRRTAWSTPWTQRGRPCASATRMVPT